MKNLFTALLFMAIVIGYMPVGFTANAYNSIDEINLDGEEAIGKTATLKLKFFQVNSDWYIFIDENNFKFVYLYKDAKFKNIIRSIIKSTAESKAKAKAQRAYSLFGTFSYFITFKIIGFTRIGGVFGEIIKINDSENKPME